MQLADIERFAVDDCILLTNSRDFQGWEPEEIKTTVLGTRLPVPDDVEQLRAEKLPIIEKDYFNSSHYRLVSFTPSFSDSDRLEVVLAHLGFMTTIASRHFLMSRCSQRSMDRWSRSGRNTAIPH
jgi:hypothetical protein